MALTTVSSDRLSTNVKNTNFTAAEKQDLTDDILPLAGQVGNRNLIINGAMQVAQRNTSVTGITSGDYYVCDRWKLGYGTAGTWTLAKSTDTPDGFGSSFKFDCTTANGSLSAGSNLQLLQFFEGQNLQNIQKGTSTAKEITVSFYVKTNKTGTYIVELMDHDNSNRHCSKSYTVTDTNWNRYTLTFPADTTGALDNDNAKSFEIGFWLAAGSNFTTGSLQTSWGALSQSTRAVGQVNLADNTSNEWYITGVQLEVGSVATDFEHKSYGDTLWDCQRYLAQLGRADSGEDTYTVQGLQAYSTSAIFGTIGHWPRQMRAKPTITLVGVIKCADKAANNVYSPASGSYNRSSKDAVGSTALSFSSTYFIQGGFAAAITGAADGANYIQGDAEL